MRIFVIVIWWYNYQRTFTQVSHITRVYVISYLKLKKNRSPVKLFSIKKKMNFYDPSKTDIGINNKTELEGWSAF